MVGAPHARLARHRPRSGRSAAAGDRMQQGNPELATAVDAILTAIESDGTFGRLTRKWELPDAR